ncbi:transporter substrate-binding domain-containing protein [Pararhizobium sp. YC-54]|uniref:transporter substrate-binding domain-containing protein n=1 Tax=Pararhizobium sp. YC-54 TaxID=2986920 RepID=UPI0021F76572|nr:transporter substrate-binding domain-containing protein [Pararhizobium sp. YC-54]MCV9999283.1 transporter substrate-binding domain-containing protein [Pararhizobium sp. YC-54]
MHEKNASTAVLLATAIASVLLAVSPANAEEVKTINAGTLLVGSDQVYPPYDYIENGVTKGFDADVMAAIGPKLGVKIEFADTRFASLIPGLQANRFDVIASALYVTPARAQVVDYIAYAKTGGSLMVRADDTFTPKVPEDLCGKRVANLKGAAWVPELQKVSQDKCASNPIDVREFATSAEAAQALLSRGADVVFDDAGVSKAAVVASGDRLKITSTEILFPVVMGLAVKKGNDALLTSLKAAFEPLKSSKEYEAILARYNLALPSDAEVEAALAKAQ